jgi:glycosyltransferase involved in cell wall biosynthesis
MNGPVSAVVAARNRPTMPDEAIENARARTTDCFRIIVVDDGTRDAAAAAEERTGLHATAPRSLEIHERVQEANRRRL